MLGASPFRRFGVAWPASATIEEAEIKALGKGIALGPPPLDPGVVKAAAEILDRKEMAALGLAEPERVED